MQSVKTRPTMINPHIEKRPGWISIDEVSFHPHSIGADDCGRLFRWEGQLYRAISSKRAGFFEGLFNDGILQQLVERGLLIDTVPTDLKLDGYAMVVKHRSISYASYPQEWSATMLRDASVATIDLAIELAERGLTLSDAHPWNIVFDACTPVWVDLTSITRQEQPSGWRAYDEFCRFCYYPLILMAHGYERIARALLPEYTGVQRSELMALMRGSLPSRLILSKLVRRGINAGQSILLGKSRSSGTTLALFKQIKRELETLPLQAYHDEKGVARDEFIRSQSTVALAPKQRMLRRILTELKPAAVLDLSGGETWSSLLPAGMGFEVISAQADPVRATTLYTLARENSLRILPLILDFIKPTPAVGYSSHYAIGAAERLKCDLVLAFGLAQRVALKNHLPFDLIAEGLSSFSRRWLLVDFVSRAAPAECEELGSFVTSLRKHFSEVRTVSPAADREVWLLCEKKAVVP